MTGFLQIASLHLIARLICYRNYAANTLPYSNNYEEIARIRSQLESAYIDSKLADSKKHGPPS